MPARPADGGHSVTPAQLLREFVDAANALRRVTALVARGASEPELFSAVAREVALLLGADVAGVLRYEPDGTAAVAGWWGLPGMDVPLGTQLTVAGENMAASALQAGGPVRTNRFEGPAGSVADLFRRLRARSGIGAPITLDGRLLGG